jgi:hypothetical protein
VGRQGSKPRGWQLPGGSCKEARQGPGGQAGRRVGGRLLTDVLQLRHAGVGAKVQAGAGQEAPPLLQVLPKRLPLRHQGLQTMGRVGVEPPRRDAKPGPGPGRPRSMACDEEAGCATRERMQAWPPAVARRAPGPPPTCAGSHSRPSAAWPSTSTHLSYSTVGNSAASLISSPPAASQRSPSPVRSKPLGSPETCGAQRSAGVLLKKRAVKWVKVELGRAPGGVQQQAMLPRPPRVLAHEGGAPGW